MLKKIFTLSACVTFAVSLRAFIQQKEAYNTPLNSQSFKKLCNTYMLIAQETKNALADWSAQALESFDPHVGDMACHVGTVHVLSLIQTLPKDLIRSAVRTCMSAYKKMIVLSNADSYEGHTFESFLKTHGLPILAFSPEIEFLSCSHFVTSYYSPTAHIHRQKVKLLSLLYNIHPHTARELLEHTRFRLNSFNNTYIQKLSHNTLGEKSPITQGLLVSHTHDKITTHSAYCAFKTVYEYISCAQIPLILNISVLCKNHGSRPVIHPLIAGYRSLFKGGPLVWLDTHSLALDTACYISDAWGSTDPYFIKNSARWDKKIKTLRPAEDTKKCPTVALLEAFCKTMHIQELWLCQAATHPQFKGSFQLNFNTLPEGGTQLEDEYQLYKIKDGQRLHTPNPALFLVHDYPSRVGFLI